MCLYIKVGVSAPFWVQLGNSHVKIYAKVVQMDSKRCTANDAYPKNALSNKSNTIKLGATLQANRYFIWLYL